ncbi:glycosyltransferase [Williamsia muralis]|uniref:glycosyltransferase n=1 Tax=Williamsia marianensis TaxID=85044 RepID=UPI003F148167
MSCTIAIPFTAIDRNLEIAIKSVFAQTSSDWSLLLVADGVPDVGRLEAIDDSRVTVVGNRNRAGLATRLNEIAWLASTRLLFRMDADDIMHPRRLELQREVLHSGGYDVVGTRSVMIDSAGKVRGGFNEPSLPTSAAGFLASNAFSHPTVAGLTDWFRANPYDKAMLRCQDKELWIRTAAASSFYKMDDSLLFYRINQALSAEKQALSSRFDRKILKKYGPRTVGHVATTRLVVKSRVKQATFGLGCALGQNDRIYMRKFSTLDANERYRLDQLINSIERTKIPGWAPL